MTMIFNGCLLVTPGTRVETVAKLIQHMKHSVQQHNDAGRPNSGDRA